MATMTKGPKGKAGRSKLTDPKRPVLTIRGSDEWRDWVHRLAEHMRLKSSDLVDRALVEIAERNGFKERPPQR